MSTHFNGVRTSEWALHGDVWSCFCSDSVSFDVVLEEHQNLYSFSHWETSVMNSSYARNIVYFIYLIATDSLNPIKIESATGEQKQAKTLTK